MTQTHEQDHSVSKKHHHHSHAHTSEHGGGHHLLQVEDLCVSFEMYADSDRFVSGKSKLAAMKGFFTSKKRLVKVIDGLNISVHQGEIVAIVGASGSGKSLLADAIMGLYEPNSYVSGDIWFDGAKQSFDTLTKHRGRDIAFVPQGIDSLDPLMRVGKQVIGLSNAADKQERKSRQAQLFAHYGLDAKVATMYPHELSGGMARRVLLCSALMSSPKLLIADEPTVGLDLELSVKAMQDFRSLADEGVGVMLITHDIDLALRVADRIAVFRDGTVVEETSVQAFKDGLLETEFARSLRAALPEFGFECGLQC